MMKPERFFDRYPGAVVLLAPFIGAAIGFLIRAILAYARF
jgi:hypothetical protein